MLVNVIEIKSRYSHRPEIIRSHILQGYVKTYCGIKEFDGFGVERELAQVNNLCASCKKLAGVK